MRAKHKNPDGGLTEAGRKYFKKKEGANLKAPVNKKPETPEEIRRQGSFLVRMGSAKGPLKDENGNPTRLKKSLEVWNHHGDKASAVAKGRRLLARYKKLKENRTA
jgi:hypothetical protein